MVLAMPKVLFVADPLVDFPKSHDTTWAMMLEANRRGFEVYHSLISDLGLSGPKPFGSFWKLKPEFFENNSSEAHADSKYVFKPKTSEFSSESFELDKFDYIFMRKDPPVDQAYIYVTQVLSACKKACVINNPRALRDFNEKLVCLNFPGLISETLVSSKKEEARTFLQKHKKIVLKPIDAMAGAGIFVLEEGDRNFSAIFESLSGSNQAPVIVQKYIPEIETAGDKRVILVKGEPIGALKRIASSSDHRANMARGGSIEKADLNDRDLEIIAGIKNFLVENNIFLAGIDIIGDYLTEINITSPTCFQEINKLNGLGSDESLEAQLFDSL